MFAKFSEATIVPRGTDFSSIGAKIIVLFFRGLFPDKVWKYILLPLLIIFLPILILAIIVAHLAILLGLGSQDDPLGYTVILKK